MYVFVFLVRTDVSWGRDGYEVRRTNVKDIIIHSDTSFTPNQSKTSKLTFF